MHKFYWHQKVQRQSLFVQHHLEIHWNLYLIESNLRHYLCFYKCHQNKIFLMMHKLSHQLQFQDPPLLENYSFQSKLVTKNFPHQMIYRFRHFLPTNIRGEKPQKHLHCHLPQFFEQSQRYHHQSCLLIVPKYSRHLQS